MKMALGPGLYEVPAVTNLSPIDILQREVTVGGRRQEEGSEHLLEVSPEQNMAALLAHRSAQTSGQIRRTQKKVGEDAGGTEIAVAVAAVRPLLPVWLVPFPQLATSWTRYEFDLARRHRP